MRCGFLGLLHMEIISERLAREFNLNLINTVPSVLYKIHLRNGEIVDLENPDAINFYPVSFEDKDNINALP